MKATRLSTACSSSCRALCGFVIGGKLGIANLPSLRCQVVPVGCDDDLAGARRSNARLTRLAQGEGRAAKYNGYWCRRDTGKNLASVNSIAQLLSDSAKAPAHLVTSHGVEFYGALHEDFLHCQEATRANAGFMLLGKLGIANLPSLRC